MMAVSVKSSADPAQISGVQDGRTARIGSAADTATWATEPSISVARSRTVPSKRSGAVGIELERLGRQAHLVEQTDERHRVELLDVDHPPGVPLARRDQPGGGDRRDAGGVADGLRPDLGVRRGVVGHLVDEHLAAAAVLRAR